MKTGTATLSGDTTLLREPASEQRLLLPYASVLTLEVSWLPHTIALKLSGLHGGCCQVSSWETLL
jgi:hypothetical protein